METIGTLGRALATFLYSPTARAVPDLGTTLRALEL